MKLFASLLLRTGCLYGAAVFSPAALAQTDQRDLGACSAITDNNARLACYDALARPAADAARNPVSQVPSAPTPATVTAPVPEMEPATPVINRAAPVPIAETATPVPVAPTVTTVENFGAQQPRLETGDEGEAELVATIAAIDELEPRKVRITLSDGQVWKQSIAKSFMLRANDTVRITRSPWGGTYRLHKDGKPGYIQVERLR